MPVAKARGLEFEQRDEAQTLLRWKITQLKDHNWVRGAHTRLPNYVRRMRGTPRGNCVSG